MRQPPRLQVLSRQPSWRRLPMKPRAGHKQAVLILLGTLALGCQRPESATGGSTPKHPDSVTSQDSSGPSGHAGSKAVPAMTEAQALRARDDLPPDRRALVVVDGKER